MAIYDRISALADTSVSSPAAGDLLVVSSGLWSNKSLATALNGKAALADSGGAEKLMKPTVNTTPYTVNLANGNVYFLSFPASNGTTTLIFAGQVDLKACSFTLYIKQPGSTFSRSIVWPASVKWPNGTAPTLSAGGNKTDLFVFETVDNGTVWYGSKVATYL